MSMKATYHLSVNELNNDFIHVLEERFGNAALELTVQPSPSADALTEEQFWQLIDLLDWTKLPDEDAVTELLTKKLAASPLRHIYDFYDHLAEKLYSLDGVKYATQIGEEAFEPGEPFSTDHFLDVRSCVVANGKEFYFNVLRNPEKMPQNLFFENLTYVASTAYERKTGKEFDYLPRHNYLTFSNKAGWKGIEILHP